MKTKIKAISFMLMMICSTLIVSANIGASNNIITTDDDLESNAIKVAILSGERLIISRMDYFVDMFEDYQWIVGNVSYSLDISLITDEDILSGKLNTKNYHIVVVPGGGVGDGECMARWYPSIENIRWKRNFAQFIIDGGGYYSVCGGTALITELDLERKPRSELEIAYEKSSLDVSCVQSHYEAVANPMLGQFAGLPLEAMGPNPYCMYSGFNSSDYLIDNCTGVCLDCKIVKDHPIFDDFLEDTRRIRWISGPSLTVPENPDREVSILAYYPEEEISDNTSTQIHYWRYTGGIRGLIKGFFGALKNKYISGGHGILSDAYAFAGDWKCVTDKLIETDYSNRPAMTAEIYPNKNEARIVLTGLHPEDNVWWGGYMKEADDTEDNNLWDALYKWADISPNSKDLEWTYNYWINRRSVAWASKLVNDNDLPPVYGPSQVCDFEQNMRSSEFTVYGNSETSDGVVSLKLYYSYSSDGINWTSYSLYDTDDDVSNGISWEFDSPDGAGHYQFYSIRIVDYEGFTETEKVPPGADAIVRIIE